MRALIVSLEMFQKGGVPPEVEEYIASCGGRGPLIVLDESSKIKANEPCKDAKKSRRAQAVLSLNRTGERLILTGPFMSKSPVNAYDQMSFLKDGFFPEAMHAFAERYVVRRSLRNVRGARTTLSEADWKSIRRRLAASSWHAGQLRAAADSVMSFYGLSADSVRHIIEHREYTPFKHLDELWSRIGRTCLRVRREDVFDTPPKVYRTVAVRLTDEQKKLYKELEAVHCTEDTVAENPLELFQRFQDVCNGYRPVDDEDGSTELFPLESSPKLDALTEVVEDIGDAQVIVWCSRTRLLNDAAAALREAGHTVGVFDGKVRKEDRERDYGAFSRGDIQVLLMNQASGAYGLDGLRRADYAVYLSNSYSVEHRCQSEERISRGEVVTTKFITDIVCRGTCEDRVTSALRLGKELVGGGTAPSSLYRLTRPELRHPHDARRCRDHPPVCRRVYRVRQGE